MGSSAAIHSANTPSAPPAPNSPNTPATTPRPPPSTPKRPHAGKQFGNVPERAYALLGQGRCLLALGDPAAEQPLREAAELFSSMGYRPALAETKRSSSKQPPLPRRPRTSFC